MYTLIYLLLGIFFNLVGPIAKKTNASIIKLKSSSMANYLSEGKTYPQWKIISFIITFRALILFFYPLFFIILIIDYYRNKNK
jgi:hypothetical protein